MELSISVEELRKRKLFIAVPMYGGMNHGMFMKSCLDLQGMLQQYGIESRFSFIFNESLITRARNYLADEFLRAEGTEVVKDANGQVVLDEKGQPKTQAVPYTHMLFIDADIHFDPRDVLALLAMDKDIAGGPYPKKSIKWWAIKEAVQKHPNIEPGELDKLVGDYVFNPVVGTGQFQVSEPLEVMEIGTGYMMIKREVFEKFKQCYPESKYKPDHVGQKFFDGSRYIHAFFDCIIDRKREITTINGEKKEVGGSERYLSEDYFFCQQVRNAEIGKIWLCPWFKTHHIGTYAFTGDLGATANLLGKL